ncbi:MAG: aspartate carbamoyltransferase catalytic subunit [Planctomycetes bacterium]|jgi:aspartate carbamoyltransferase catalytic subunit|nr:aspartate carbamoyltransferase catalytic subunit [Planctomycetota bacterium]MCL4731362.1 aspartate carbamoyltransferase catalytic subunit [Planctomycetota bacterium]
MSPDDTEQAPPRWTRKDLLGLEELTREEILHLLDTARGFSEISTRSIKKAPALRGKVVLNLFFEPSTRTKSSFSLAAQRLSADLVDIIKEASSATKGESLVDTGKNLQAMGVDIVIVRHQQAGAPHLLARALDASVINAGDGTHEHPTQGLLDIFTMREKFGDLAGKKIALVGDITHSRVARSNIWGLRKLGVEVGVIGPRTLVPGAFKELGVNIHYHMDEVLGHYDVFNILRIQLERQRRGMFPSVREYHHLYGIDQKRLAKMKPGVLIMHPGPINRGVEISHEVADGENSVILQQVSNGLAVRMAALVLTQSAREARP